MQDKYRLARQFGSGTGFNDMVNNDLLTFELDEERDQLFIHGDPSGLRRFAGLIEHLASQAEQHEFPHAHLFTEKWGGDELSSPAQEVGHTCLNHVKVYCWPDARGSKPYQKSE